MRITGLHLLLTYQCTYQCDHCFVWGSPWQSGTMTLRQIRHFLKEAEDLGTVEWFYFEGGEPYLYHAVLLKGVQEAASRGFRVGIVSNAYWATEVEDSLEWLRPFAGLVEDLSISSDLYHATEEMSQHAVNARTAAEQLGIPVMVLSIPQPDADNADAADAGAADHDVADAASAKGQLAADAAPLMYRGRAAEKLVARAARSPWSKFIECPHEDLREPERLHVDPFGNLHICQGLSVGNLFRASLREICESYNPETHPLIGPLLEGGPAELARRHGLHIDEDYVDACHLCFEARRALRERYPEILTPDQMYGEVDSE